MGKYDLHIHTTFSDGDLSVYTIIDMAKRGGFDTIAITDHETIKNFNVYNKYAKEVGINLISGIENNVDGYVAFHILGYGIKNIDKYMEYLNFLKTYNQKFCYETLDLLKKHYGINSSAEDLILEYSKDGLIDKKIIAKELIKRGYASGTKEAYDKYIGRNALAYSPIKKVTAPEIIQLIHACQGAAVWAHPQLTKERDESNYTEHFFSETKLREIARWSKDNGLDGIEAYNHTTDKQAGILTNIAQKLDLVVTGGSDFHSMTMGDKLGCPSLKREQINALLAKIEQKATVDKGERLYE